MKRRIDRSRPRAGLLLLLIALPTGGAAQTATVRVERENFRAEPRGTVLAEVVAGAPLTLDGAQDRWREATIEGWIWSASVRDEARDGHDLVVAAGGGENLRVSPNGRVIARLRTGMRLDGLDVSGNWLRVRRSGWIWGPSLSVEGDASTEETARPSTPLPRAGGAAEAGRDFARAGTAGLVVLDAPTGDTLASVSPGVSVRVLAREGDWTRVSVEGWTFTAALGTDTDRGAVLSDVMPAELRENPEAYRGRLLEWTVQFIALQEAERFRTDFIEGEPFMLTRGPGEEAGFVYVAVPAEQLDAVRALSPLQKVRLVGRVRTASSALTGAPVLDLLDLEPQED